MKTLKDFFGTLPNFISKHAITIIAILICAIFFMVSSLMKDIKHTAEIHKLTTESLQLNYELGQAFEFTQEQGIALQKKNEQLEQAQGIMSSQSFWLQRMMEKLKELKAWPLEDPKPVDPDTAI